MRLRGPGLGARRVLSVECPLSSAICRVLSVECYFAADQILLVDKVAQNSCSLSLSVLRRGGGSGSFLLDKNISDSPSLVGVGIFCSATDSHGSREYFSTPPSRGSRECGVWGRLTRVTGNISPSRIFPTPQVSLELGNYSPPRTLAGVGNILSATAAREQESCFL